MNLRDEAEELAIALTLGFATVEEAVRWADGAIGTRDDIPLPLIDVSCGGRLPALEVAHLLRMIPGQFDVQRASRGVVRRMASTFDAGRASLEHMERALDAMQVEGWIPEEQAVYEMIAIGDNLWDARNGTYRVEEATGHLREFLRRYGA